MNKLELPKPILLEDLGLQYYSVKSKRKHRFGRYLCGFCGSEFKACIHSINQGKTKSCGCYNVSKSFKHGLVGTRIYSIWIDIKSRVFNSKSKSYNDYGGRGITLCDEWLDVQNFYDWAILNGYEENKGLSIDRIDNDGNYEPSNCRWVTQTIQSRNQRMQKNNKSGYKGVCFKKDKNKYAAQICVNNKNKGLGHFLTAVEAGIAYNNYIIENNLEGFILNEIPEGYENG